MGIFPSRAYSKPKIIYSDENYSPHPLMDVYMEKSKKLSIAFVIVIDRFAKTDILKEELLNAFKDAHLLGNHEGNIIRRINYEQSNSFESNSISTYVSISIPLFKEVNVAETVHKINRIISPSKQIISFAQFDRIDFQAKKHVDFVTFEYLIPTCILPSQNERNTSNEFNGFNTNPDIDISLLNNLAKHFVGTFQFQSKNSKNDFSKVRTINEFFISEKIIINNNGFLIVRIKGRMFFKGQIEKMISLFLNVYFEKFQIDDIQIILDSKIDSIRESPSLPLILINSIYDNFQKSLIKSSNKGFDLKSLHNGKEIQLQYLRKIREKISNFYFDIGLPELLRVIS